MTLSSRVVKADRLAMGQDALKIFSKTSDNPVVLEQEVATRVDQLIGRARREAEAVLEEAQEQARLIVESARARGYEEGLERGLSQSRNQWHSVEQQLASIVGAFGDLDQLVQILRQEETLTLAAAMAARLFPMLAERDPDIIRGYLNDAANQLDDDKLRLFVSKKWEPYLKAIVERMKSESQSLTLAVDQVLSEGEWRLEGDHGGILAGPVASLQTIVNEVIHGLGEHPYTDR